MSKSNKHIIVRGAREHNLQNISVRIPRDQLVVITGRSGSGKSSLAFDTIYQEGQRRFLESLSSYARQFLGELHKPDVDAIEGLSPTICIDQKTVNRNPRSTVGTVTETFNYLRLLMARLGEPRCPHCGHPLTLRSAASIVDDLLTKSPGKRLHVMAPIVHDRKGEYRKELATALRDGFIRARIDGTMRSLEENIQLARYEKHSIELVVDRLKCQASTKDRLTEAIERALKMANGLVSVLIEEQYQLISGQRSCPIHGVSAPEMEPRLFSFNAPQGMCQTCNGLGFIEGFSERAIIDSNATVLDAFLPMHPDGRLPFSHLDTNLLRRICQKLRIRSNKKWSSLTPAERKLLLHGADVTYQYYRGNKRKTRAWPGLLGIAERVWHFTRLPRLKAYRQRVTCHDCQGERLNAVARAVIFRDKNISFFTSLSIRQAVAFFSTVTLQPTEQKICGQLLNELVSRLTFLNQVGLGYLSLNRPTSTLSGGEAQRIRLAAQVGSGLQGVTYILDEPSIGLHQRDQGHLLDALIALRDKGNSILVVEHDPLTMASADFLIEVGPGAGRLGGQVTAAATPRRFWRSKALTAAYLRGEKGVPIPSTRRSVTDAAIWLRNARANNLQNLDVCFPLQILTVVTGVSGSGKSTLIEHTLCRAIAKKLHGNSSIPGLHDRIEGLDNIDKLVVIDQSPIGRTPRSNPATYTGLFTRIRELFAQTLEARRRGYSKSRFSFNVSAERRGGRCEECEGAGVKTVEMHFLSDVHVVCEACNGKRFNHETLDIRYKGKTIADVLALTIDEAAEFFANQKSITRSLQTLRDVGLGYISLGQPSTTLSGGEAQRIKLATALQKRATGKTLYVLDEPTTGLHMADVELLLVALQKLVDRGNSIIVIEHDVDVIKSADYIIDLGPEGGDEGGRIVGLGTPEDIARLDTPTGRVLATALRGPEQLAAAPPVSYRKSTKSRHPDIQLKGVQTHNLQRVNVKFPQGKLTVVTGPSGSGKSSLVFHTLFAEGQRRYIESLSTYARRFLGRMQRPPIDEAQGLAPAIAIDQRNRGYSPRSTVATATELHDLFRLLFARISTPHCPKCSRQLQPLSTTQGATLLQQKATSPGWITTTIHNNILAGELIQSGYRRILVDGHKQQELVDEHQLLHNPMLIIDRCNPSRSSRQRLAEAVEKAYEMGRNKFMFFPRNSTGKPTVVGFRDSQCPDHGKILPDDLTPKHFSFNSRIGACSWCDGLGRVDDPTQKKQSLIRLGKICPQCNGDRLQKDMKCFRISDQNIATVAAMTIEQALQFWRNISLTPTQQQIAQQPIEEITNRLTFLVDVGLGYLQLDRTCRSLSGGEIQRIRLASQLGSKLTQTIYVLDEPTVGLHSRDTQRLLQTLDGLRQRNNSLVVVEHDPEVIAAADYLLDLGPAAGEYGGKVVATGPLKKVPQLPGETAAYLCGRKNISRPSKRRSATGWINLKNVTINNLVDVEVRFPRGCLTVVTGVSGSGKSTLVMNALVPHVQRNVGKRKPLQKLEIVDQKPLSKSPRSTPISFCKILDPVRDLFAATKEARARGWKKGRFSYNTSEGRCPHCEGRGALLIEMHFLSDVWIPCDHCNGARFEEQTLSIRWKGLTIADVLHLSVSEARQHFQNHRSIKAKLDALELVGLGYLRLGQPANQLSGGEAQRLKLANEIAKGNRAKRCCFLLDEPTTGLHYRDVEQLLKALHQLVDAGHMVVVIEHNLDVIWNADHIIDLGPEGGLNGGKIIAQGSPEDIIKKTWTHHSHTAEFMKKKQALNSIDSNLR